MTSQTSRRAFVGSVLASVPALGLEAAAQRPTFPPPDVTAADSLMVYIDMLRGIQAELIERIVTPWQTAQSTLSSRIKELNAVVDQLAAELGKKDHDAAARFLALAAMGRGVEMTLTGGVSGAQPGRFTITRFTEACRTCTDLDAIQDVAVTPRAYQLIQDVIRLARELEKQDAATNAASAAFGAGFVRVQQDLDGVRDLFLKAAAAASSRTRPEDMARRRDEALRDLDAAKTRLANLEQAHQLQPGSLPRRDALIEIIQGTRLWLTRPPSALASIAPAFLEDTQAVIRTAEQREKLWDLLEKYSPAATLLREIYLRAILTPIWIGYTDRPTRERLIREVLRVFPSTPPAEQSAAFVSALATLV